MESETGNSIHCLEVACKSFNIFGSCAGLAITFRTYRNEFLQLLKLLKHKPVNRLQIDDITRYMVYAMEKEGIKENTAHSRLNALKFYFEQVLGRERYFHELPRPKKARQLPGVFNQVEIANTINSLENKKHRAMIMLAYGAGLRVSEVVTLNTFNVDSKRMTLFVQSAKGEKGPGCWIESCAAGSAQRICQGI